MEMNLIVTRIQKLLALAAEGSGATEAEANSAMEKAQAIMNEHNLTMAELVASGGKGEGRTKEGLEGQAMFEYQQDLMRVIAGTNYCYVSILNKWNGRRNVGKGYRLIGTQSNVATAKVMFEYLMQTINRLVMAEINNDYRQRMSKYAISWCAGCSARLQERIQRRHDDFLQQQKKEAEDKRRQAQHPASPSHGALVVVMTDYVQKERDLNNDFMHGWEPGTTEKERLTREAAKKAKADRKRAEALAAGFDAEVAETYAEFYFENPQAAYDWLHPDEKTQEKNDKYWEREYRKERNKQQREFARRDWSAYSKGQKAGSDISLNAQVSKGSATKAIK